MKMKTVKVSEKVHRQLSLRGKKGMSFNQIIEQLLEEVSE
jgi:predicted HicB family RNase H-like nuclease